MQDFDDAGFDVLLTTYSYFEEGSANKHDQAWLHRQLSLAQMFDERTRSRRRHRAGTCTSPSSRRCSACC